MIHRSKITAGLKVYVCCVRGIVEKTINGRTGKDQWETTDDSYYSYKEMFETPEDAFAFVMASYLKLKKGK